MCLLLNQLFNLDRNGELSIARLGMPLNRLVDRCNKQTQGLAF